MSRRKRPLVAFCQESLAAVSPDIKPEQLTATTPALADQPTLLEYVDDNGIRVRKTFRDGRLVKLEVVDPLSRGD